MVTMNTVSSVAENTVATSAVAETKSTNTGAKGMTNFNKLSDELQNKVQGLVDGLIKELGGDNVDYAQLLGAIDLINAEKKAAKEIFDAGAKERKEAEKELAEANASKLHDALSTSDVVDYLLKSQNLVIKGVKIEKITDKRFHVELKEDTVVVMNDKEVPASSVANLKLGKKYVAFEAITSVNGKTPAEFLSAKDEPQVAAALAD